MSTVLQTDHIRSLIQARDLPELSEFIRATPVPVVVDLVETIPSDDAAVVFRLLDKDTSLKVFEALDTAAQADLIAELGQAEVVDVFSVLDPEEQARLLDEVPAKVAKRIIGTFEHDELDVVLGLLGYPQGSVGRRMSPGRVHASPTETVGELTKRVRSNPADQDLLNRIPVTRPDRTLVGVVDLVDLLRRDDAELIEHVMCPPASLQTGDDAEIAARSVLDDSVLLLPVVDRENRLVGVFPITDAAHVERDAVDEDHARAGATDPLRRPYLMTPIPTVARSRIVWLLVLAVSAVLTVNVLELFETTLAQRVALALFIPLVTGIGGNTGSQAATTVTRALALGDLRLRDIGRVAFKEVRTGFLLGATLAILGFTITSVVYGTGIGTVIGLTLVLNCPIAATVGGVIPLFARACRIDPAVFSTPFISTFCDASGLLVYFTVAINVLGL